MKKLFTKGNWEISNYNDTFVWSTVLADNKPIIECLHFDTNEVGDISEVEANAKLIAAAPNLLKNLIRCVDRLEENGMGNMSTVKKAKKAIKKAIQ